MNMTQKRKLDQAPNKDDVLKQISAKTSNFVKTPSSQSLAELNSKIKVLMEVFEPQLDSCSQRILDAISPTIVALARHVLLRSDDECQNTENQSEMNSSLTSVQNEICFDDSDDLWFECAVLLKYLTRRTSGKVPRVVVDQVIKPVLHVIQAHHERLTFSDIKGLHRFIQFFPALFAKKFCEKMLDVAQGIVHRICENENISEKKKQEGMLVMIFDIFRVLATCSITSCEFLVQPAVDMMTSLITSANIDVQQIVPSHSPLIDTFVALIAIYPTEAISHLTNPRNRSTFTVSMKSPSRTLYNKEFGI